MGEVVGVVGSEWSLPAVHDVVAAAVPDREMLICGDVRRTYGEVRRRSRSLAAFLVQRGLGVRTERESLEPWENGQDTIALVLDNSAEYLEAMLGAFRARAAPFNVNQHYQPAEVGSLLGELDTRGVVYHLRHAPLLAAACDTSGLVLVHVEDGSGEAPLPGSVRYEDAARTPVGELPTPSPDDLYVVCTGGTTGRPKAVLWRQGDVYCAAMAGVEGSTAEDIAATAVANSSGPWFPVAPLMHAAAQWTAFSGLHGGATVVLRSEATGFDAADAFDLVDRERVALMSVVGDAFIRPMVDELRTGSHDLSSLGILATGGAATSPHLKDEVLARLPSVMLIDGYGSSETGGMAFGPRARGEQVRGFQPSAGATVVDGSRTRELGPGEDEIGWVARRGRLPLGYLGDPDRTASTFPRIDGVRMSVPGDRGRRAPDGSIELLGRDAMVVNSGGEKVFVEEVEQALSHHPDVLDVLVVGRPSARFGQEVVAVVAPRPGAILDPFELREFAAASVARFKAPRAVVVCDEVRRHANGKADYRWALEQAVDGVDATQPA